MSAYELDGTIKVIFDLMTFDSGFTKREFVVTTDDDRYPQDIKFECVKEKCALLDERKAGDRVKISFDLRGNEYKDRYYVNLSAWRVEPQTTGEGSADAPAEERAPLPPDSMTPADDSDDDLPF